MCEVVRFVCECCADGVNQKSHEILSAGAHHLSCETSFRNLLTEPHYELGSSLLIQFEILHTPPSPFTPISFMPT